MEIERSEQEIEEFLSRNLEIIEPELKLIRKQYKTKYGIIDILCFDKEGNRVAIEVKKYADTNSPGQLSKYVFALKKEFPNSFIRGILVSSKISNEVMGLCSHFYLNFGELSEVTELMPTIRWPPKISKYEKF